MRDVWPASGAEALARHAPLVLPALRRVVGTAPGVLSEGQVSLIRAVTAEALGLRPLPGLTDPTPGPGSQTLMAFAEQFAVDITSMGAELRADARAALGLNLAAAVRAVYVADAVPRLRAALDAVFGPSAWSDHPPAATAEDAAHLDDLRCEIALLRALDPVTSELVRLRCARQYGCRVSMARRSVEALEAGAGAATFAAVDHYRGSDLTPRQQAALALTDAMIWMPADLRDRDREAVRAHLAPAEAVEVMLDVAASSADKMLVALGTDLPPGDGVVLFAHDDAGRVVLP